MSVTATRSITIGFAGDVDYDQTFSAEENTASPAQIDVVTLDMGANTITAPSVSGVTVTAVTIIPPSGNAQTITLKGISGDTGIALSMVSPTTIGLNSVSTFVLTAGASIPGVRLIWS